MRRWLGLITIGLALGLGAFLWWKSGDVPHATSEGSGERTNIAAAFLERRTSLDIPSNSFAGSIPAKNVSAAATLAAPRYVPPAIPPMVELTNIQPEIVLENLRHTLRQFSARIGGNPVGTNPEIAAALNGGNQKQARFLNPEDGLRLNVNGELVDNWGTPFFFHQLSAQQMEIHSAGPDRILWTADDLVIK